MAKADAPAGPEPEPGGHNPDNDDKGLPTFSSRDVPVEPAEWPRQGAPYNAYDEHDRHLSGDPEDHA